MLHDQDHDTPPAPNISELPLRQKPIVAPKPPTTQCHLKANEVFSSLTLLSLPPDMEVGVWRGAGQIQQTAPVVNTVFPRLTSLRRWHGRLTSLPGL